jgi:hypothetical protein
MDYACREYYSHLRLLSELSLLFLSLTTAQTINHTVSASPFTQSNPIHAQEDTERKPLQPQIEIEIEI